LLGGRAAEDLVFGQPSTGAEQDLRQATGLARRMVGLWGMSEEVGLVSYGLGEAHPFLGRELAHLREYAEATAATVDTAVRRLLDQAHRQARAVLERHRAALDTLVDHLLVNETVDGAWLDELLARPPVAVAAGSVVRGEP
jgi:cell division protease FtsH